MSDGDDEDTDGGEFGMSVGEDGEVTFVGRPPWGT